MELKSGKMIKCLRTDNSGEYSEAIHGGIHPSIKWSGKTDEHDFYKNDIEMIIAMLKTVGLPNLF